MLPEQILAVFDGISDPRNSGKLTRIDYVNAQNALVALSGYFRDHAQKHAEPVVEPFAKE